MTQEALEQAKRIEQALKDATDAKRAIMVYNRDRMELEITVKKGLMHFNVDDEKTRHYTLWSDSPLFVAIAAALEGIREELQEQLDNLDSNIEPKPFGHDCYEDSHPIAKTSWWEKAFRWAKPKK